MKTNQYTQEGAYPVWQIAYCADCTHVISPSRIKGLNLEATLKNGNPMVGRAFTVYGGEIYLDALEAVPAGK